MGRFIAALGLLVSLFFSFQVFAQQPKNTLLDRVALFEEGMNRIVGTGYSRSDLTALDYFHRSADLGYVPAQVVMGYFAETGLLRPQDGYEAAAWYSKAAAKGDPLAQWVLGRQYFTGTGESRDLNEAERWLRESATQGDPFAAYLLGSVELERQDYTTAAASFRKAAERGLPQAQRQLGLLLKTGRGVPEDKPEAYVWLLLSFEAGNKTVGDDLKQLEADLGSSLVEQAKTKARGLQTTVARSVVARGCTGWTGEFDPVPTTPPPQVQKFCH